VISFIASSFVGLDCLVVAFVYSVAVVGPVWAFLLGFSGCILNWYIYHRDGVKNLSSLFNSLVTLNFENPLVEALSLLGAIFVGLFVFSAYQNLLIEFVFLNTIITPPLVIVMSVCIAIGTYILNKEALSAIVHIEDDQSSLSKLMTRIYDSNYVTKFFVVIALVVTVFMTNSFFSGAMQCFPYLAPLISLGAAAFLIGELAFNIEQPLNFFELMAQKVPLVEALESSPWRFIVFPTIGALIILNAVGNGLITLELKPLVMTFLPMTQLCTGVLQSAMTMTNSMASLNQKQLEEAKVDTESTSYGLATLGILAVSYAVQPLASVMLIVPAAMISLRQNPEGPDGSEDLKNTEVNKNTQP
tara:strand:- start:2301 stop:3377 length:1077 start_codon:yes stop_codon:yes gene_type:complete